MVTNEKNKNIEFQYFAGQVRYGLAGPYSSLPGGEGGFLATRKPPWVRRWSALYNKNIDTCNEGVCCIESRDTSQ